MKNGLRIILLLAFYGLLFVVFTWPLAANFKISFLAVSGGDSCGYIWDAWHFRKLALSGHNPYVTDWLFFPQGTGLIMHGYLPVLGLLNLGLNNPILAVNLGLLLSAAASGAGAYLLARRWVQSPVLGLLAGFVFTYSPFKLQRLTQHFNLQLTATIPFYILLFLRAFEFTEGKFLPRVRSWGAVVGCFGLGVLTLLSDYYVLFGLLYFSLAYAAWFWFRIGRINWRAWRTWAWLVVILVAGHIIVRLLRLSGLPEFSLWWAGDLVAFLMPPPTSRFLYSDWAARLYNNAKVFNAPGSLENTLFIGYALPLLALVLWLMRLARQRPLSQRFQSEKGRPLAWVLVIFLLFTVPTMRIYGHDRLNLPTAIIHFIPFFNNIRCPTRWILMVGLLLPIVSFSALEAAWTTRLAPAMRLGLSLLLAGLVLVEFWPTPYQRMSQAAIPRVFREVAKLPGTSLVPIPLGILDGTRQVGLMQPEHMFYQTEHAKKLPIGYLSRVSPELFASLDQQPVLHALLQSQTHPDSLLPAPPTAQQMQDFLRTYDPAAFVIHPDFRDKPVHAYLRQLLQPYGYQEQLVDGYVLLALPSRSKDASVSPRKP
ncbi:hypothetical protein [Hymenobacter negativus]|uniref:Glycosyltransferase RgtA/B/C/D-like domain-containing protein n=1 Tax=Hymenobacter negativus TaxID=2795026 RepID=A0ABS3QAP8_9BACT|nr:hypothetical protein [Hymenobacter negativus]MBO2008322.1 hypothetical protein [Hymenobacter negativus]